MTVKPAVPESGRPFTTYKVFGGVLVALTLPPVVLTILRIGVAGNPPMPIWTAMIHGAFSAIGIYVFSSSDRKLKELKNESALRRRDAGEHRYFDRFDWRGMAICAAALLLYLAFMVISSRSM